MKKSKDLKPNYAPVYAALYPDLCKIFQKHGYALAIHGSLARDFDLIAIPWGKNISDIENVLKEVTGSFAIQQIGEPEEMNHGRIAYTLNISHGECFIDLSVFNTNDRI